jgi:HSP20 family molecular chaperone IbpA
MNKTLVKTEQDITNEQEKGNYEKRRILSPMVDILENDEAIILLANMPGVSEENIEILLEKDELTIIGTSDQPSPQDYKKIYGEKITGDYKRRFILSDIVDRDRIEATLMHGVLRLELGKIEKAKPQQIPVHAKG